MTLDELQKLCDEATPGPWEPSDDYYIDIPHTVTQADSTYAVARVNSGNDMLLIAASREALPKLLAVAKASETWWKAEHDSIEEHAAAAGIGQALVALEAT